MPAQPTLKMNDERQIPQLGFGTWRITDEEAPEIVHQALDIGYWMVDTAAIYRNENGVGKGIGEWSDIFLQTKVWNDSQGYERAKKAFHKSLERLDRSFVDMLLIHWPCPEKSEFVDTWKAMIELREEGLAHSIGVSNFRAQDLEKLVKETGVTPAINQIELHPHFQQRELRQVHKDMGIVTQSWSPLGKGRAFETDAVRAVAEETGQPIGAVVVRWHIQHGLSTIPRSKNRTHMEENFSALAFELTEEQMARIDELDDPDGRIGERPEEVN